MIRDVLSKLACGAAGIALMAGSALAQDDKGTVEVLHWWTSGGEAAALNVLKENVEAKGVTWQDMPVAGGGGEQAMTVLRARVTSGNPPTAVQMLGYDILDWAGQGVTANLNDLADKENWDAVVPAALQEFSRYEGEWIAAPVNVHSTNWVWANKQIFDELGLSQPAIWDELIAALDKIEEAGHIPVAHGGQAWQDGTVFEAVVLSTGGPEFYQKALLDLDPEALGSDTMKQVFDRMAQLRTYVDENFSGRDWNLATAMVADGRAGVQFMGDWAKGEFANADKQAGEDFLCFRFPGTQDAVTFNSDQFVMFAVGEDRREAQTALASTIMDPEVQARFNQIKGSVPARTDVSSEGFDMCGRKGMEDLAAASENGTLFGSLAHGHGAPTAVKNAVFDVVTTHFNGQYDSETAVRELVDAVAFAQ